MNLRSLGILALVGAPFLLITFLTFGDNLDKQKSALDGVYSVVYMGGWMCSIVGLWQVQATGTNRWGRIVLVVQLLFLSLASISNIMLLLQAGLSTKIYFVLDMFWPVSNIWMLATGITIVTAKRLQSWMRFVPLLVGLWLPVSVLAIVMLGKTTPASLWISGLYSAVTWTLLALVVYRLDNKQEYLNPQIA